MEIAYLENKIKNELLNKEFKDWNKESIVSLVSVFQYSQCKQLYTINLILLDDYIKWIKKNTESNITSQYSLEKLVELQKLINSDLYNNQNYNYEYYLEHEESLEKNEKIEKEDICQIYNNCSLYTLFIGLFLVMYLIFSNLSSFCFSSRKVEIARHDNELKLPLPDDLMGNPLIKLLLQKIF